MTFQSHRKTLLFASFIIVPEILWGPLLSIVFVLAGIKPTVPPLFYPIPHYLLDHIWLSISIMGLEVVSLATLLVMLKKYWTIPRAINILLNILIAVLAIIILCASYIAWGFSRW